MYFCTKLQPPPTPLLLVKSVVPFTLKLLSGMVSSNGLIKTLSIT